MSYRIHQINELIKQELNTLLVSELEFPQGCLVTITAVETSKDLRHAKIWVSVLPGYLLKKAIDKLNSQAGHLQFLLNKKLSLKPLPRIKFAVDKTEEHAADIDALLDRIKE